jgi:extradiol dioxygenase family protein
MVSKVRSMKPLFSSIPFFVYPVTNMPRARAFYGGVLGLKEGDSWEDKWVEYEVGSCILALSTMMEGT